jgi:hypothetical protein
LPERRTGGHRGPAVLLAVEVARLRGRLARIAVVVVAVVELRERVVDLLDLLDRLLLLGDAPAALARLVGLAVRVGLALVDRLLVLDVFFSGCFCGVFLYAIEASIDSMLSNRTGASEAFSVK